MTTPASIPRRIFCGLLIAVFAAVLLLPLFSQITKIPPDRRLGGFRYRIREFPAWTLRSWLSGQFASTVDAWTGEHIGLRGWQVILNRQLRYWLFGQVEAAPLRKRAMVIGTPPMLYENILLVDALRQAQIPSDQMEDYADRLARMQAQLREQGMAFAVVVAPNKALIYTNSLPAWARPYIHDGHTDFKPFVDALRRRDVPCLDTMTLFRELTPEHPDLVPPHAIHWGHHGAWIALQQLIPLINRQDLLPPIPVPETEDLIMDKPSSMNDELRGQLNLLSGPHMAPIPSAYPVAAPLPPGVEPMLDVLIVGDSFGFTFMDALARSRLCRVIHYWFYMKSLKQAVPAAFDSREIRGLPHFAGLGVQRPTDENGTRILEGKNVVFLVVTTFNIDKFSWGFDRLVNRLYGDSDEELPPVEDPDVNLAD